MENFFGSYSKKIRNARFLRQKESFYGEASFRQDFRTQGSLGE